MSFLACVAEARDGAAVDLNATGLGRELRRFNLPVKLALLAGHAAAAAAADRTQVALVSLAPCRPGSPELWEATRRFERALHDTGRATTVRVNPTYTLHAIDNLALSSLAIALANRAPYLGLGGAPGQAWGALEFVLERAIAGDAETLNAETLIMAGDQDESGQTGHGVAVLFSARPRPLGPNGRTVRLVNVERTRSAGDAPPLLRPHAARGLGRWLDALAVRPRGRFVHDVAFEDGDGVDRVSIICEVT